MADATALVSTRSAGRLIDQLCQHWSHEFEVEQDANWGHIDFGDAQCSMSAHPDQLVATVHAEEGELERLQGVVADHLQRMAPEQTLEIVWL